MPSYDFKHPDREEYVELFFGMNESKSYVDKDGVEWERVFYAPNVNATNRSYDPNKPIYDEKGNPMKVVPITDELVKSQGFDNASDYIEWNNSMVDESKCPEANLEKAHEQAGCKDVKELIKEQNARVRENNQRAAATKAQHSNAASIDVVSQTDGNWDRRKFDTSNESGLKKMQSAYDKAAYSQTHRKITVNGKEVANADKPKKQKKSKKKT